MKFLFFAWRVYIPGYVEGTVRPHTRGSANRVVQYAVKRAPSSAKSVLMADQVNDVHILARYIACNRRTIKCHLYLGLSLLLVGCIVIIVGLFGRIPDKVLSILGGVCVSAFTCFPIKEIRIRQEKIELMEGFQGPFNSPEEKTRVHELIWKALEKTIVG